MDEPPEHVAENRRYWNAMAHEWVAAGERAWAGEPSWGMWGIPETEIHLLPTDMSGKRAIDLGCGTGYVSAWMARRGAAVTAIDISEQQLATARRLADDHAVAIDFIHGSAEAVPQPDASFDFALSEYGAAIWCDPTVWIPEAVRLLKPGGTLVFLGNHPLTLITTPPDGSNVGRELTRPYFGMHLADWRGVENDPGGMEFNLTISDWMALFSEHGLSVERYLELQAPLGDEAGDADEVLFTTSRRWAHEFPSEQVWVLTRQP
jgi:SAM-dependent methyltransferase